MTNLLDLDPAGLAAFFAARGEKPFRARQVSRWVHQRFAGDIEAMSDLGKALRERLAADAGIGAPQIVRDSTAADGTRKWLIDVGSANAIETVYIPEDDRGTLCISSQAGCALDCAFCSTGKQGFNRNLTTGEIVAQLWHANRTLLADGMSGGGGGHGRAVGRCGSRADHQRRDDGHGRAARQLRQRRPRAQADARRQRVRTVAPARDASTSGLVPQIDRLRDECPVALAVSLHAPTDALRDRLVPINRVHPLAELMAACVRYIEKAPRDFVTFEYVMLDDVNDADTHAHALLSLVRDVPCKFNLIPFNPFPGTEFRVSPRARIAAFQRILADGGFVTTIRKTRGDDIDAACGQLAGQVHDRTKRRLASRIPVVAAR